MPDIDQSAMDTALAPPAAGRADIVAEKVLIGLNWTLVRTADATGLAQTPPRGALGCRPPEGSGALHGRTLGDLAGLTGSANPIEVSVGCAARNAAWNLNTLNGAAVNGLDLVQDRGTRTVIIGRFPDLQRRLPGAAVIEKEPGPEDYPEEAAEDLLPKAEFVVITASALVNGTLPRLLTLSQNAWTVLVGPGTPLSPRLFDLGLDALSGFCPVDLNGLETAIAEGAGVRQFRRYGRFVTLRREECTV